MQTPFHRLMVEVGSLLIILSIIGNTVQVGVLIVLQQLEITGGHVPQWLIHNLN